MTIYLYIKQHSVTGLKYFGKHSATNNPWKYPGSGTYWTPHIKKYGKEHVKTLEVWSFDAQEDATYFAINFSNDHNIVESNEWANKRIENAIDGGSEKGWKYSEKSKEIKRIQNTGENNPMYGKIRNDLAERNKLPKKWVTKNNKDKLVLLDLLEEYLDNGYELGRVNSNTKGIKFKRNKPSWNSGKKIKPKFKSKKRWVCNDNEIISVNVDNLDYYLSLGYQRGRKRIF